MQLLEYDTKKAPEKIAEQAANFILIRPSKLGIFIIWLTLFKYERSFKQTLVTKTRAREFTSRCIQRIHCYIRDRFEKVEWDKLVLAEIKASM